MSDATTAPAILTPGRTKALASLLAGAVLAMAGALAGGTGDVSITTTPHPGLVARLDAIEARITGVERRLESAAPLAPAVEGLRQRLDLLLALDTRRLDAGDAAPTRSRR